MRHPTYPLPRRLLSYKNLGLPPRPFWKRLNSALRWLTEPSNSLSGPISRRANLLAWLLVCIILLSMATLLLAMIANPSDGVRRDAYMRLILGLMGLTTLAYSLNRAGHYYLAAGLTIACALLGPWGSLLTDPRILEGDFVPLTYVALTVLLSSILLPAAITVLLAGLQLAALAVVPLFSPAAASINWPSLVMMVFFTSVLSIVVNIINQRAVGQIEQQTRQFAHS